MNPKQIKILHIANIDVGLKNHLGNYMRYQVEQGYNVSAVTNPGKWIQADTTIFSGIKVKIIHFQPRLSLLADLKALFQLYFFIRQNKFDVVHTHTVKPGLLGRLAARAAGVPVIVHTVHGFYFYEGMSPGQYQFYVGIEKLGAACGDLLLSQNQQDIDHAIQLKICPPEKIHLLGNGIDLSRFDPASIAAPRLEQLRREMGIANAELVVGFAARFEQEKGVYEFIEAAKQLKGRGIPAKFLMIGAAQSGKKTAVAPETFIHEMGLEKDVLLPGYREDMPELLALMDVVVLPSHGREGIPRILMESAAMGRPVVATSVRGIVETVLDGQTGLLVPARDANALAEGIARVLMDASLSGILGQNARKHALAHFNEKHFFWKTDLEYRRLLESKLKMDPGAILKPVPGGASPKM